MKLYEMRINILITHIQGTKNNVADFLSRLYYVPDAKNLDGNDLGPKSAQHILSPFSPLDVLTKASEKAFLINLIYPCKLEVLIRL